MTDRTTSSSPVWSSSPSSSPSTDRGQLLLLTTFGIAVLILVLGLVLNSAVYTGTTATRDDVGDDKRVLAYQHEASRVTERVLTHTNDANMRSTTSYASLRSTVAANVSRWSAMAARHDAAHGRSTVTSIAGTTNGTLVASTDPARNLTNASGTPTWTLVANATATRGFHLNVSRPSLVDAVANDSNSSALKNQGTFRIIITAGGDTWTVFVYQDQAGNDVLVKVDPPSGGLTNACRTDAGTNGAVVVDVSNASVGGQHCRPLTFFDGIGTAHDLAYERGDNAAGTYSLVVDRLVSDVDDGDFVDETTGGSPFATPAMYAATIRVESGTPRTLYVATVTVVPGDGDA